MSKTPDTVEANDPNGSIFLFERLTAQEYERLRFAILLGRGSFRGMSPDDLDAEDRLMRLRVQITARLGRVGLQ